MNYIHNGSGVINADCLAVLPTLPEASIDLVLTDPPYLVNYHDRSGRQIAGDNAGSWLKPAFAGIGRASRPGKPLPDVLPWRYTGNRLHPTQKPVPALKPVIETFSRPGETVLDPFCGSGSTLLAAKILGRRYLGIELDSGYCQIARKRVSQSGVGN